MWDNFSPTQTVLAGQSQATLQTWLNTAQGALNDLMIGGRPISVSYGDKSVTYTPADISRLSQYIHLLQRQLGLVRPRHAIVPVFR